MLKEGPAQKVTVYVSEEQHYHGRSAYTAVLDYLFYHGVSGATVTRAIAGFGSGHEMHTADLLRLSANLPIKIEFIEEPEKVSAILPKLRDMLGKGMITLQETQVLQASLPHPKEGAEEPAPHLRLAGRARLMRIYLGEADRWHERPLHEALVESLRAHDIAGVTVYRGILGYGAGRRLHKDHPLSLSHDRPIMLSVVDTEEKLTAWLPLLDTMLEHGLVVLSDVDVIRYSASQRTTRQPGAGEEEARS